MQDFPMCRDAADHHTPTPQQELARAELLHRSFPNNVTEQAALAAAKQVAAHNRRAGMILQMHKQAIAAADDTFAWQRTLRHVSIRMPGAVKSHDMGLCWDCFCRGIGVCCRHALVLIVPISSARPNPARRRASPAAPIVS
jgi:hypothetical protein